ncbi:MAG: 2-dehydropantoate 2-reductase [Gammaproteobacteria bacterium]|nr:2-dehydropantoate 2-reductase [Gammaproteobacteria bacterium]
MRICIYGAGATGGYLGVQLALAGEDVTLIARGAHLAAMQANGVRLLIDGEELLARPRCIEDPVEAGPQDYVIVTLKAHSISGVAERMQPLLGKGTAVVTATNGVPWWYFYGLSGAHENRRIESVDPGGRIWDAIGPERAIGCVLYPATEIIEPGVIRHIESNRLTLGEPLGRITDRTNILAGTLRNAGFRCRVKADPRDEIWLKLLGNLSFNPISALTHATLDRIAGESGTLRVCQLMMQEARAIAERLGATIRIGIDRRIAAAADVGSHRTSMLQDLDAGRPMEIDALVTAVQELGRLVEVPTPTIDVVLALIQQRGRTAGTYGREP